MDMDSLIGTVIGSTPEAWTQLVGPTGFHDLIQYSSSEGGTWIESRTHHHWWTYLPDVSIALAYGLPYHEDQRLTFVGFPELPDPAITGYYTDVLYHGTPVHRVTMISVDGGRAVLPMPYYATAESSEATHGFENLGLKAPRKEIALARLVNLLIGHPAGAFDEYFKRSGIIAVPER
jgi:hypothetical protein